MDVKKTTQQVRESSFGWMIKRLAARLDDEMNANLAPLGLDLASFAIMMTVLERSPLSQAAIGERLQMAPYKVSRSLDTLEALRYLARHPDPASRRAHVIRPTELGQRIAPQLYAVVSGVNGKLAGPLSEEERRDLAGLLTRMVVAQEAWTAAE
ncbi:MarR family transcriptional regulator [Roseobacter sp. HKCCD9010]|uniref:MarR family winged helix-turn-helix transcriptional regulator n=1 Tax=unclassified Roseobacter TaxID=196798 RepID=UPI001491BB91|nr:MULTISPECIES: MarR family winged helix-turn-helix transcriptional regulator [unclassified Roseobacter]MBF9049287.1 MarR family transcriptional regulator [Rhodobacterales bacterium HKCCD4356]NNV11287.1 MarR family transcriptional regulator [Roseobacter sp. HKCCD7357]NNV15471.1 MarR family transcriptional regulator [Roseobacter sp. HKCCD8768]NNV24931.1 MarR family transcriptional regulator [Roseobacter sp. HKCCD8192]NNV29188.1 MarR family transcriptional regulator [Roseobacter sp. HKCCD9061]